MVSVSGYKPFGQNGKRSIISGACYNENVYYSTITGPIMVVDAVNLVYDSMIS